MTRWPTLSTSGVSENTLRTAPNRQTKNID